jgi:crotonobetainyl-CoA:carnitine CoA-transferase CaiB-like acyl-CoA transferase
MAAFMLVEHANGAMFSPPLGPAAYPRVVAPRRRPYRTLDGEIAALVYNDKQWNTFIKAVQPPWNNDSFNTLEQRARQIDTVYSLLAETFAQRTTQEWLDLLRSLEIPAAPLRTLDELFDNPHLNAVDFFETVDSPNGPVRFPGVPTWFSKTPGHVHGPTPRLGAHTQEVLAELGLTGGLAAEQATGHAATATTTTNSEAL